MGKCCVRAGVVFVPLMLAVATSSAADKAEAKGEKADYKVYNSYFVSNKADLKGESTYFAFADQDALGKVLRPAPPNIGQKREYLPRDIFDSRLVAAVVKRGNKLWEYQVEKVTVDGETMYVQYKVTSKNTDAVHAVPLIIAADKGKVKKVVFIENGEKAGTAEVGK